ncbi:tyrosine-protein kinase family protein [Synechocystis sp. CACIAM 05]|uniref:tyrosine-protein kinase family protein n=1 Tax=Synechocystis sp. CACIAM 05 TaxID=1933929 RepID=UPI00138E881A|nr:AAA family ATPase [Synechocystis sp. CACIAM 05]QHV00237.1 ATPase [Synechocystis sp. CACIAM 05]
MANNWKINLKEALEEQYISQSFQEWIEINFSSSNRINLTIVSDLFRETSLSERKDKLLQFLESFSQNFKLSLPTGFLSLYTREEAQSLALSPPLQSHEVIRTWHDLANIAANPQNQNKIEQQEPSLPRTIVFYSFKGGVGRTTALNHVAWQLAMRGRKVVAVDLDLEAPGLSTSFSLTPEPNYGIVDYFYERSYLPEGIDPDIDITDIFGEVRIPNATGRLFVVPSGSLSLDYIEKIDDLRASTVLGNGKTLWSSFTDDIKKQLNPDLILVDSRTGINKWGALSLLEAADEAIIFLFPNEQNRLGVDILLKSLNSLGKLSLNFVFSPVPAVDVGIDKVRTIWKNLNAAISKDVEREEELFDDYQSDLSEPLVIPYLPVIALAEIYPVLGLSDYYTKITNLIDEETNEIRQQLFHAATSEKRWEIIENLTFPALNAANPSQELENLFQRTANFDKFLDETTCLIRGRKGTGKTALYLLLLKHEETAKRLANGRLAKTILNSGHGSFIASRPTRSDFLYISNELVENGGTWEVFWCAYLLLNVYRHKSDKTKHLMLSGSGTRDKYKSIHSILQKLPRENWQSEHSHALVQLATDSNLRLLVLDALVFFNTKNINKDYTLCSLYDDLDEDFPEAIRQQALTGLFQLIQFCDARSLKTIRFKVFLREDIWEWLNFDNKSHFNGRDLLLEWTRVDFLRLALRQATQSPKFKELVDRTSPVISIDQASEEDLSRALDLLWGSRRRKGQTAKYVSRWVYERLTDSSGSSFPRSLSALLEGAKNHELTYRGNPSIQTPTDRLLRARSLEIGLEEASKERCDAIKQEYPHLSDFFNSLEGVNALITKDELDGVWQTIDSIVNINSFNEFVDLLTRIGIIQWREKDEKYRFADIYISGFKMKYQGTK